MPPPKLRINPPLVNSSNPWATDFNDLKELYECPYTGAVTTRTSLLNAFHHDSAIHQFVFFDPVTHSNNGTPSASLNSLGYSPHTLDQYLEWIADLVRNHTPGVKDKGFIVSVTGAAEEVVECYKRIGNLRKVLREMASWAGQIAMEINLSCPNIPGKPPPAYDGSALDEYLSELTSVLSTHSNDARPSQPLIPIGLKSPPFTHATQYDTFLDALNGPSAPHPGGVSLLSFVTATNTLGSCMVLAGSDRALPGAGLGGMAGAPLHPLSLGNVDTLSRGMRNDKYRDALGHVQIIGVGGVSDAAGARRMGAAGATVIGVGTAFGIKGIDVFREISDGLKEGL
jgi:dihydroorotate dehydrogenase (fumarate)